MLHHFLAVHLRVDPRRVLFCLKELEQAWFLPFIGADEAEFRAYLEEKRRDRVWGDDPEIQVCVCMCVCS